MTKFAVLGLVARRPTYGYAVLRQLKQWSVTEEDVRPSSVYNALDRLTDQGLIQRRDAPVTAGADRKPRTMYVATDEGEDTLESWSRAAPASFDELRVRIALARSHDLDRLMRFVMAAEEECLTRLEALESVDVQRLMTGLPGRSAPIEALNAALLGSMTATELDGRLRSLQMARATLEALRSHPHYGERS